jgi:hypothetical protein
VVTLLQTAQELKKKSDKELKTAHTAFSDQNRETCLACGSCARLRVCTLVLSPFNARAVADPQPRVCIVLCLVDRSQPFLLSFHIASSSQFLLLHL